MARSRPNRLSRLSTSRSGPTRDPKGWSWWRRKPTVYTLSISQRVSLIGIRVFSAPAHLRSRRRSTIFNGQGIWGTPVIDPSTNSIYLVSSESYVAGNVDHYTKTLHAIDLSDGTEMPGSPVVIADTGYVGGNAVSFFGPSVRGTGAGSIGGRDYFYVLEQLQRPGLMIDGNDVVIAFGSSYGDQPPMHGWILAYDKNSLQQTGMFNVTPNGQNGGVWNTGNPLQADSQGYLYTETGNGTFDAQTQ